MNNTMLKPQSNTTKLEPSINKLFNQLTGNKGYKPYSYQIKVTENLIRNELNIFLCAPTGAGKTWAALLPFLWARSQGIEFADRLIYVLPLRSLATSLYQDAVESCSNIFNVKTLPEQRIGSIDELIITIQTGEQKNDSFFEGDIVFTTIDQCLSSYLNCPVSLPTRLGNINAGALLGSLIVFDEFHLLDPDKSMKTAIEMLNRIKPYSKFIIMTATLAIDALGHLKEIIGGEIVSLTRKEVLLIPSQAKKKRTYKWIDHPLTVVDILKQHKSNRSIVIVNTVKRAQDIFIELQKSTAKTKTTVYLLHSRFFPQDRGASEEKLKEWFGKDADKTDVILITTQVVEAGMDISADNLHTELAPMNSIVQRAGRCARYTGERGIGTVSIYELEKDKKGNPNAKPYDNGLVSDTRSVLGEVAGKGKVLNFDSEIAMLNKVHTEQEATHLNAYTRDEYSLKERIYAAMDGDNSIAARELIRDVSSVNVIISDDPYSLQFNKIKWPRMLSVPRSSLYQLMPFFEADPDFRETVAWYPVENSNIIDESDISFGWERITSVEQINTISWLIVISPKYASYSADIGLQIGKAGDFKEVEYYERPPIPRYKICFESYREHAENVIQECRAMNHRNEKACQKLTINLGITDTDLGALIETACALHDVGKLSVNWQKAASEWQTYKNPKALIKQPIAHTDYDPEIDFDEKKRFSRQPPHASEGSYAAGAWLKDSFGDFGIAAWTAIARHHGAFTGSLGSFELIEDAERWAKEALPFTKDNITLAEKPNNILQKSFRDDLLFFSKNEDDVKIWPLYAFIVRCLRLADQRSQRKEDNEKSN